MGEGLRLGLRIRLRFLAVGREEFDDAAQHFVAVAAFECERELRGEQAVFQAEVVAAAGEFDGEVALVLGELLKIASGREQTIHLRAALSQIAEHERYLAVELAGRRYDFGLKYGLLTSQLALALEGCDRDEVLRGIVELLATGRPSAK